MGARDSRKEEIIVFKMGNWGLDNSFRCLDRNKSNDFRNVIAEQLARFGINLYTWDKRREKLKMAPRYESELLIGWWYQ